ncbi:hypothetical protein N9Z18_02050 [Verrucomicrobiales bacterium]|nr:hypothetical protein [Verrucomicrobiales bacterium]
MNRTSWIGVIACLALLFTWSWWNAKETAKRMEAERIAAEEAAKNAPPEPDTKDGETAKTVGAPTEEPPKPFTFTTSAGKTYQDAVVMRLATDAIQIRHAGGIARIPLAELPEDIRRQVSGAQKKMITAMEDGIEVGKTYDIIRDSQLLNGPSDTAAKIINQKATQALGTTHFLSIDTSCTIKVTALQNGWAQIAVVEPDHLAATHKGWISAKVIKKGNASKNQSGWVRNTTQLFTDPDGKNTFQGIIIQKAAISVADSGGDFLELQILTAPIRSIDQQSYLKNEEISGKLYLPRANFTTKPPGLW